MKRYIYTVFVGSIYWKSFNNKKESEKEASILRKDGAKNVRVNKELDD